MGGTLVDASACQVRCQPPSQLPGNLVVVTFPTRRSSLRAYRRPAARRRCGFLVVATLLVTGLGVPDPVAAIVIFDFKS